MNTGMILKVNPEILKNVSMDVNEAIEKMDAAFQGMNEIVNSSSVYWEGRGERAYVQEYREKVDMIEQALKRFRENVTDLQTIAGIYEKSEQDIRNLSEKLPTEVIS